MFIAHARPARILALLVASCMAAALVGCNQAQRADANEIPVGSFLALTGGTATYGISTRNGIQMAMDEVNAQGGVLNKKVKLIIEDDQGKPEEAQTAVTKLINKDGVVALLGEVASSNSLAAAPVAQQNRIPMVSPASTNPRVTEIGDRIFRTCFIDPFQGHVMATFAYNSLGKRKVAILKDVKSDYSVGLADFFEKRFKELGGEVVGVESYSEGDNDFSAQLTSLKTKGPDALFLPGYYTEVGLIARQARKLGLNVPMMGGDAWDSPKLYEIGGEAVEGNYFSSHFSNEDPSPVIQKFVNDYKARYGQVPDALAALGYDAARLMADALKRAGTAQPDSIRDALASTTDFEGVTGKITFDANRNPVKSAVVLQIKNGKPTYLETIQP